MKKPIPTLIQGDKHTHPKLVAVHYNLGGHSLKDFKIQILEMLPGDPEDETSR